MMRYISKSSQYTTKTIYLNFLYLLSDDIIAIQDGVFRWDSEIDKPTLRK